MSNAEPRETLTPWGKMSMAYFAANESVEVSASFAKPAWACTGCFGCREHCDHKNDVAGTLFDARSALLGAGEGPPEAKRVLDRFKERASVLGNTREDPRVLPFVDGGSRTAVLVGCEHARGKTDGGVDAVRATSMLLGTKVAIVDVCCGAPLLYAGDAQRFKQQAELFEQATKHLERLVVADAGCASTIRVHYAAIGITTTPKAEHFSEVVVRDIAKLEHLQGMTGPVRWHDPCQLGRGLGVYDAPRQILSRVLGRAPDEFERRRDDGRCSGAGGLLPVTMPDVARAISEQRLEDHERSGGGTIVTACASSKRRFEKSGAKVLDLATVVARALEGTSTPTKPSTP